MEEAISDPTGFQAILTEDCWQHIVSRHPEMKAFRQFVVEAIRTPDGIYSGKRDPARKIYRKRHLQVPGVGDSLDLLVFVGGADRYVANSLFCSLFVARVGCSNMAFQLVQEFKFEKVDYSYDGRGDVLDISFGPPAPAIALQVEDWLAIQVRLNPPSLQGLTIVGFKWIFEKINRYAEKELPQRMRKLASAKVSIAYENESDTLVMRWEEEASGFRRLIQKSFFRRMGKPSIFEPLSKGSDITPHGTTADQSLRNVYVEKNLPSKDIIGIKILEFTKCGPAALEGFLGAIVDTLFEPNTGRDENVHLITNALVQRLDWQRFATIAT